MTKTLTDFQVIRDSAGRPEFAVVRYADFQALLGQKDPEEYIPHAVVGKMVAGATAARAWREHLDLTQAQIAERIGITQAAYSQLENSANLRPASRRKIAEALGISFKLLL